MIILKIITILGGGFMNKKIVAGMIMLGTATMVGLSGCGSEEKVKYTVTFDANNNGVADADEKVVEFTSGTTGLNNNQIPSAPEDENGFAGVWESFILKDENIIVNAKYGDGTQANPYLVATAAQFAKMLREERLNRQYFKLIRDIDFSTQENGSWGANQFCCAIDGNGHEVSGLKPEHFEDTNGCLIGGMMGGVINNLSVVWQNKVGAIVNNATVGEGGNSITNVTVSSAINQQKVDGVNATTVTLTAKNQNGALIVNNAQAGKLTLRNCKVSMSAKGNDDCNLFNAFVGTVAENAIVDVDNTNTFDLKMYSASCHTLSYTLTFKTDDAEDSYRLSPNDSVKAPILEDKDGFSGVWVDKNGEVWTGSVTKSQVLTSKYGDGTQANPYLVSNATQFEKILIQHSDGTAKYFKLINNIDLANITVTGENFCGEIDGCGYTLRNVTGTNFIKTDGAIFNKAKNAVFKNFTIELGKNIASLVALTYGNTSFENITVNNVAGITTFVTADDNNEGPFVQHVKGGTTSFINCTNNANIMSTADYFGVFVGGYADSETIVNFTNCVNNGNITTAGSVGILFGNPYKCATSISVDGVVVKDGEGFKQSLDLTNVTTKNTGKVVHNKGVHVLMPFSNSLFSTQNIIMLDALNIGGVRNIQTDCTALVNGNEIVVNPKGESLPQGEYELILSAFAGNNRDAENGMSVRTNISIKVTIGENETSKSFGNVLYGFKDLATYQAEFGEVDVSSKTWTAVEGYLGIRYFLDETNGVYVVDYSGFEQANGLQDNRLTIDTTISKTSKLMVAYDGNDVISFVTEFEQGAVPTVIEHVSGGDDGCGNYYSVGINSNKELASVSATQDGQPLEVEVTQSGGEYQYRFELINPNCSESPVQVTYYVDGAYHASEISFV